MYFYGPKFGTKGIGAAEQSHFMCHLFSESEVSDSSYFDRIETRLLLGKKRYWSELPMCALSLRCRNSITRFRNNETGDKVLRPCSKNWWAHGGEPLVGPNHLNLQYHYWRGQQVMTLSNCCVLKHGSILQTCTSLQQHQKMEKMMTTKSSRLSRRTTPLLLISIFFIINTIPQYALQSNAAAADSFVRPPARSFVFTPHKRSKSDPEQVHISLVGKDHIKVSWVTNDSKAPSVVEYGKVSGQYEAEATGENLHYHYFLYKSGRIHHVKIGPLEPTTTYYYRCSRAGPEFYFRTPPSTYPIEFVVVGDLGQTEWTQSTLDHVNLKDYDVFLLPGDLSYADTQQPLWDSFGRLVEPYASKRPWMVTQGNHEVEVIPIINPEGFKAYNARWPMPYQESGSNSNLYYSFEVTGAHIIMLGSYTDFDEGSDQYSWLQADLQIIDRVKTPWVIVLLHAPWYNSNEAHKGEGEGMRKAMEELLYDARVDVVFSGHVHAYERFTRVYNKKADPCGPIYITIGDGGNREGLALSFENPAPSISMYREPSFGHGRLRIFDDKTAYWSWHRNNESDAFVADELWLDSLSSSKSCNVSQNARDCDEL